MTCGNYSISVECQKAEKITTAALNTIAKCYNALSAKGATFIFNKLPETEAAYLIEAGVQPKHIRSTRISYVPQTNIQHR